jgi:hypothetical protein
MEKSVQASRVGRRETRVSISLRRDEELRLYQSELIDPKLPRKATSEGEGARTGNRHR